MSIPGTPTFQSFLAPLMVRIILGANKRARADPRAIPVRPEHEENQAKRRRKLIFETTDEAG